MFRRRVPLSLWARIVDLVWPRPGWRRAIKYQAHRLGRMPDSPHKLAAGLSSGIAIALTPLIGFQLALGVLLALLVRGNILASTIGSFIANPWTLPAIWDISYHIGRWLMPGSPGEADPNTLEYLKTFASLGGTALTFRFDQLPAQLQPIWMPMLVGSMPLATVCWVVSYWLSRRFIERYQARRRRRRRFARSGAARTG